MRQTFGLPFVAVSPQEASAQLAVIFHNLGIAQLVTEPSVTVSVSVASPTVTVNVSVSSPTVTVDVSIASAPEEHEARIETADDL
jgi:hypothetical protein